MESDANIQKTWGIKPIVEGEEAPVLKPMLTPVGQVEFLKAQGMLFERCSETNAAAALSDRSTFLHTASLRKLFQKHEKGPRKGLYANLDFADLLELDDLDAELRETMLVCAHDVEQAVKTKLVCRISEEGEDGYSIVSEFMASQEERYRSATERDLKARDEATTAPVTSTLATSSRATPRPCLCGCS